MKNMFVMIIVLFAFTPMAAQRVGINMTDPKAMLHVADSSVVFTGAGIPLDGSDPNPPINGFGHRMMWYPARVAFRVGGVDDKNWNRDSIGFFSFAAGENPRAKATGSIAMGKDVKATGLNSVALGNSTQAIESYSLATGFLTDASGYASTSMGFGTQASGSVATSIGRSTQASGSSATSMGYATQASGEISTAMGNSTQASGKYSTVTGFSNESAGYSSFVAGMYNDPIVSPQTSISSTSPLFIIGNGNQGNLSNAMVVLKNGQVGIGTDNPYTKLHIEGGDDASYQDNSGYLIIGDKDALNIVYDNNEILARNNEAAANLFLQASGGNVAIGGNGTAPAFKLSVDGTVGIGDNPATGYELSVDGTAAKSSGSSWATFCDSRLKQDIHPYKDGLTELLKINPVWYRYNQESGFNMQQKYVGVIAQELQQVAPYMVAESAKKISNSTTGYLQIDNSAMTYMLINAVKEQQKQIEDLKNANEQLTLLVKEILKK